MDITLGMFIAVISLIITIFTGIIITWQLVDKVKKSTKNISKEVADTQIAEHDKISKDRLSQSIKMIENKIDTKIDSLKGSIDSYIKEQKELNSYNLDTTKLFKASLIEAYKHDIRKVYYKLRETGEISDSNKAYIDKIFPMYKELGGNSDIEAKYKAMCEVYEKYTQEAFDAARRNKQKDMQENLDLDFKEDEGIENE